MIFVTQFFTGAGGVLLALSGAATRAFLGTSAAETLTGSAGNDAFRGAGGGDTLIGGAGDDTYNVYDRRDAVVENASEGIDTVQSTVTYTLGANIENLTVFTDQTYGGGNSLNNILNGAAGSQILDGKGGDDVLTGGSGADVFVMERGGGRDAITDFQNSVDAVRLDGLGLTTFAQVAALMTQQGSDVALNLPTGEQLLFRSHQISDFSAQDFKLQLDTSSLKMTFDDEFNTLSLNTGARGTSSGTWRTMFGAATIQGRTLASNAEKEIYADADYTGTGTTPLGVNPFSLNNGVLDITAAPASAGVSAAIGGYQYTSGQINTRTSFAQQYGYFEVRAKLPTGQGLWPAFWLLPANGTWPPEIDIFEQLGNDPTTIHETSHSTTRNSISQVSHVDNPDQFHTYGMLWDQNYLVWYIDGVEVNRQTTPSDMNQPMYILLNLAVGGTWPGNPDSTTPFPATMSIDYVRAYQLSGAPIQAAPVHASLANNALTGTVSQDTFVFAPGAGPDVVTNFAPGGGTPDQIDLSAFKTIGSFDALLAHAVQTGSDTTIKFSDVDSVTLTGVAKSQLVAGDFILPAAVSGVLASGADFNGDGRADVVWEDSSGIVALWRSTPTPSVYSYMPLGNAGPTWHIQGAADFDGDGQADILWRRDDGFTAVWHTGPTASSISYVQIGPVALSWHVQALADFNGDGRADVLWRDDSGLVAIWQAVPGSTSFSYVPIQSVAANWHIEGAGDFNGDGKADILWRNDAGLVALWDSTPSSAYSYVPLQSANPDWTILAVADFNGDGKADILWRQDTGQVAVWDSGPSSLAVNSIGLGVIGLNWHVQSTGDFNHDGQADVLWREDSGRTALWDSTAGHGFAYTDLGVVGASWFIS